MASCSPFTGTLDRRFQLVARVTSSSAPLPSGWSSRAVPVYGGTVPSAVANGSLAADKSSGVWPPRCDTISPRS